MTVDTVSLVLLILGIILLFLSIIKSFGNKSTLVGVVSLFVLIFGIVGMLGIVNYDKLGSKVPSGTFTSAGANQYIPSQPAPSSSSDCPVDVRTSNQYSTARIRYRNVENSTEGYLAGTVAAYAGINEPRVDTTTTTAGGAGTADVSLSNIPNCAKGLIYSTVTTGVGVAPSRRVYDVQSKEIIPAFDFTKYANRNFIVYGASYDVLNIQARDSQLAAQSNGQVNGSQEITYTVSGTGTADGTAYYLNTSLASKGSINFYIDVKVNGTSSVIGAFDEPDGIIISYDSGTAAKFSKNSLDLQIDQPAGFALSKISTPDGGCGLTDLVNNRNVEACWSAPTMKSGKLYRIRGTLTADLGDPVVTDAAPQICFDDKVFFADADGTLRYGAYTSGGTNQGVGGTCLKFVVS